MRLVFDRYRNFFALRKSLSNKLRLLISKGNATLNMSGCSNGWTIEYYSLKRNIHNLIILHESKSIYPLIIIGNSGFFCIARTITHGIATIIPKLNNNIPTTNPKTRITVHLTGATANQYHKPLRCDARTRVARPAEEPIMPAPIRVGIFIINPIIAKRRING